MSAYLFLDTKIHNAETYEDYKRQAKPIAESYGGVYRVRGTELDVIEADLWSPTRIVIIEFPSVAQAKAFITSAEYAKVKPIREQNADCTTFIVAADAGD